MCETLVSYEADFTVPRETGTAEATLIIRLMLCLEHSEPLYRAESKTIISYSQIEGRLTSDCWNSYSEIDARMKFEETVVRARAMGFPLELTKS